MSIEYIRRVFKFSQSEHAARLVLLALADNASDDDGTAYPAVKTISKKSKLSERATQGATKILVQIGELKIEIGAGRNGSNLYTILIGENGELVTKERGAHLMHRGRNGETEGANSAPKPSLRRTINDLPVEAQMWNAVCGSIGQVITMSSDRTRNLQVRRRDEFWVSNFQASLQRIMESDFLMGKTSSWRASFDWLIERPGAMAKVMEGKYDNRQGTKINGANHTGNRPLTGAEQRQVGIPATNEGFDISDALEKREQRRQREREAAANGVAATPVRS